MNQPLTAERLIQRMKELREQAKQQGLNAQPEYRVVVLPWVVRRIPKLYRRARIVGMLNKVKR